MVTKTDKLEIGGKSNKYKSLQESDFNESKRLDLNDLLKRVKDKKKDELATNTIIFSVLVVSISVISFFYIVFKYNI